MNTKKTLKKTAVNYLLATIFCIIFNYVFSYFGHSVYSNYMRFAFLYPLILGTGAYLLLFFINRYEKNSASLYNAGVTTLTVGSIFQGIIDTTGADTTYSIYYFVLGIFLITTAIITNLVIKKHK